MSLAFTHESRGLACLHASHVPMLHLIYPTHLHEFAFLLRQGG